MTVLMNITKDGYEALTETDPNNMIFSSQYNTLKYYVSGTAQLVVSGSSVETSITHNLGYIPFFLVFYNNPISTTRFSMTPNVFQGMGLYAYIDSWADTTKLYMAAQTNTLNATVTFYYKIFKNSTNL